MAVGSGKGKTILFGEHFVVYGLPSIAAGIDSETVATVSRIDRPGWTLDDQRPAVPGYKDEKADEQRASIENILRFMGIDLSKRGIHIHLGGNLVCASGIGASAASCVALARALSKEFDLKYTDEKINAAAFEGEKGYHGTPSGIDNTASTFGGLVWYKRDPHGGSPIFETMRLKQPVHLVIASTGLTASTKEVVADVKAKKEKDPHWFEQLVAEYQSLVMEARDALLRLDLKKVGELMNKNHRLLTELTVSCPELDHLVKVALDNGALGAKLTGTGRGGNMIAFAADAASAKRIGNALKQAGAEALWITSFGK